MMIDGEENTYVEEELSRDDNTELKKLATGTLVSLVKNGKIPFVPPTTPVDSIVNFACFGVDHAKTIVQIATKQISMTEGMKIISQNAVSSVFGILTNLEGKIEEDGLAGAIPVLKKPLELINHAVDAVLEFVGGPELKEKVQRVRKTVAPVVKEIASNFVHRTLPKIKAVGRKIKEFFFG